MSLLSPSMLHPNLSLRKTLVIMTRCKPSNRNQPSVLHLKFNRPTSYQFSIQPLSHSQSNSNKFSQRLSSKSCSSRHMFLRAVCTRLQRNGTSRLPFKGNPSFQCRLSTFSNRSRCPRSCSQSPLSTRLRCYSQ